MSDIPAPPVAPPRRLRLVEMLLARAWDGGWSARPSLEPDALIRAAEARTGLSLGDDRGCWRERLALLCGDLADHAALTRLGRTIAHGQLVALLATRLRARALWRRHPEIAEQPVARPIVVLGQMRSGTTRMQRLLACDPRLAHTRFYESWAPLPRSGGRPLVDDRPLRAWAGLAAARALNPGFDRFHPTGWNAPDEEIGWQGVSMFGAAFEAQWRVPRYAAAVERGDAAPAYREFRRMLQIVAWLRRDDGRRPWILKVPQFAQDLPALLAAFPDARLVCVTRDAAAVAASAAAMVANQMAVQSDRVDHGWIAREWRRKVDVRARRMAAARAAATVPQVDIGYADVDRDPVAEMGRVYRMLGMPLTPALASRMTAYLADAERRPRPVPAARPIAGDRLPA